MKVGLSELTVPGQAIPRTHRRAGRQGGPGAKLVGQRHR